MNCSFSNPKSEIRNQQGRWFLVQIKEIVDFEEEFTNAIALYELYWKHNSKWNNRSATEK
jgi:hypothetical protein